MKRPTLLLEADVANLTWFDTVVAVLCTRRDVSGTTPVVKSVGVTATIRYRGRQVGVPDSRDWKPRAQRAYPFTFPFARVELEYLRP